ncbi:MAG: glycosyltransferase family 4 protein [Peptococcaceae bacterium]|nr:glycosyltransferase family 4 protein [Peptococcaceae bacterium]
MKVCILTSAHPPLDARIFHKEAQTLRQAGYEVVIIAPHPASETVGGIRICAVPPVTSRRERFLRTRDIYAQAKREQADIYHFHDPDLIPVGLLLQKRCHKPVIYDVHEYYGDSLLTRHWIPKGLRPIVARTVNYLEKRAARSFAAIITVNTHMAGLFKRENPVGVILHNYPLASQFVFPRPEVAKAPFVLYLGGINRERGLEVILQAMVLVKAKFPGIKCELVGPVDTADLSPQFSDLAGWLERGNVQLRGKVPYTEVPKLLAQSSLALVPLLPTLNYQKAIPVKLLEYMAAGLPVVGSRFGYIEAIIRQNHCGRLAEAGNPEALAAEICSLLEDPAAALACGQNGWDAFHQCYTWESEQTKLIDLYAGILRRAT